MSPIVVENLGKRYVIGHQVRADTLRDALSHGACGLWQSLRRRRDALRTAREEFWALQDVSFSVESGDVVGIIGRNGAGKSTLLKLLSRITEPTTGRIALRGRVASLLEVGTGFHPELSGRENIFLNGAILGMSRAEVAGKFDEIVAFADVERFLDTPVKRYSSGMYVRLAFAVAAHLEPEILIVDEVLAVGDAGFQRKCLGKIQDVARGEGRTVLFVSHNMAAVERLCGRAILLEEGRLSARGSVREVISEYNRRLISHGEFVPTAEGTRFCRAVVTGETGEWLDEIRDGAPAYLEVEVEVTQPDGLMIGFTLHDDWNAPLISFTVDERSTPEAVGRWRLRAPLPAEWLASGRYRVEGAIWSSSQRYDQQENLANFMVARRTLFEASGQRSKGLLYCTPSWEVASVDAHA